MTIHEITRNLTKGPELTLEGITSLNDKHLTSHVDLLTGPLTTLPLTPAPLTTDY
jgi:hypothetical protein